MDLGYEVHPEVYAYPLIERTGLANMMFPWARAQVFAQLHSVPMLAPRWVQFRLGPIIRRETDKRFYFGLFDNSSYIGGVKRMMLLASAPQIEEPKDLAAMPPL